MKVLAALVSLLSLGLALPAAATESSLISPVFPWGAYGRHLSFARTNVTSYVTPAGDAGGTVQTVDIPIYVAGGGGDGDLGAYCTGMIRCEQIGTLQMQYALWKGSQQSIRINRLGAAVLGGFHLTDSTDSGGDYSFMQIYKDYYSPNGFIDGGNAVGKVNGQIPDWNPNPTPLNNLGWNYNTNSSQYQYFDVPYEIVGVSPLENVTFETALAKSDPTTGAVTILADFTWSFDTLTGTLTGQPIVAQNAPSSTLMSLYGSTYGPYGASYSNGILSYLRPIPEPDAWFMLMVGFGAIGAARRRRRTLSLRVQA